jgi:hypothetical protein
MGAATHAGRPHSAPAVQPGTGGLPPSSVPVSVNIPAIKGLRDGQTIIFETYSVALYIKVPNREGVRLHQLADSAAHHLRRRI